MTGEVLIIESLHKSFDGFVATNDVSLSVRSGEIHALIGPNGAGKSTLINLAAGNLRPDRGRIVLNGRDVTSLGADARARAGLARSYQITQLYEDMTVIANVSLAAQARAGAFRQLWRSQGSDGQIRRWGRTALEEVEIAHRADDLVSELSHGEKRQLELAICLALHPRLLLLDEPMAGMGPEEGSHLVSLLKRHSAGIGTLLIEHDMEAVFALADRLSVLVQGRIIATGTPQEVRQNAEVKRAYLGDGA